MSSAQQKTLTDQQIEAFHHDEFVVDQSRDFLALFQANQAAVRVVVDIGGGCGFFARRLAQLAPLDVRVVDLDPGSVIVCRGAGISASIGDALDPVIAGDEDVACFNLVLHHLVAKTEAATVKLQRRALAVWHQRAKALFVNEYIYESFLADISGWLIFQITKSRVLSWVGRKAATVVPALKANTFGVGVRFRSNREWERVVFGPAGYLVRGRLLGRDERIPLVWRLLLIKAIRRDSFLLVPRAA